MSDANVYYSVMSQCEGSRKWVVLPTWFPTDAAQRWGILKSKTYSIFIVQWPLMLKDSCLHDIFNGLSSQKLNILYEGVHVTDGWGEWRGTLL